MLKKSLYITTGSLFLGFSFYSYQKRVLLTTISTNSFEKLVRNPIIPSKNKEKPRVLIIGGGVIGITTAFYLLESQKYEVVLLERNNEVSKETSFMNGCLFCPCLCDPWINESAIKYFIKALFIKDSMIGVYKTMLKEDSLGFWTLNMMPNILSYKVNINRDKLQKMARISEEELNRLFKEKIIEKDHVDSHIKGNLSLYKEKGDIGIKTFENKLAYGYKGEILEKEDIFLAEKALNPILKEKYNAAVLIEGDTNLNIHKFDLALLNYLQKKHPDNLHILTNTSHEEFLLKEGDTSKIAGVLTNKGVLEADYYIVAAGNHCKSLIKPLGVKIPIIPVKGHSLTVPKEAFLPKMSYNVTNDETKIYMTEIAGLYRLSGAADFEGMNFNVNKMRIAQLKGFLKEMIGEDRVKLEGERVIEWSCLRPLSPDDVPIVSKIKGFSNLFVNGGHGSKGLTLALGSGVLMKDLLEGREGRLDKRDYGLDRFWA